MDPKDYIKIYVPGDGGCFFHSISWLYKLNQLKRSSIRTGNQKVVSNISREDVIELSKNYRTMAIDWMEESLDTWHHPILGLSMRQLIEIEVLEDDDLDTIDDYLDKMRDHTEYAGNLEVTAMGNVLETSIVIYTLNGNKLQGVPNAKYTHPDTDDLMEIYHNVGEGVGEGLYHYEPLYRKTDLLDFGNIDNLFETYVKKKTEKDVKSYLHVNKVIDFRGKEDNQTVKHRYKVSGDAKFKDLKKILNKRMINPDKDVILFNGSPLTEEYNDFRLKDLGLSTGKGNESKWINDTISLLIDGSLFSASRKKNKKNKKSKKKKSKKKKSKKTKKRGQTKKKGKTKKENKKKII